jgi:hypothetical protein
MVKATDNMVKLLGTFGINVNKENAEKRFRNKRESTETSTLRVVS